MKIMSLGFIALGLFCYQVVFFPTHPTVKCDLLFFTDINMTPTLRLKYCMEHYDG